MEKKDLMSCIDYFEKEIVRLEKNRNSLVNLKFKTEKIDDKIEKYQKIISEFSKNLLNSEYVINVDLLAFILEDYVEFFDLTKGSGISNDMDAIINCIREEFKKVQIKK